MSKNKLLVASVIIPYFNDEDNISNAINSVLKQSLSSYEILIIDNELSINSKKILKKIKSRSKKIKLIENNSTKCPGGSRNKGIRFAKGKYCAFLDSDDKWKKDKLKKQINFMKKNKIDFSFTGYTALKNGKMNLYSVNAINLIDYNDLIKSCPICCSSVIIKSKILKKNLFKNYKTKEDYELWLRLSKKTKIMGLQNFLTFYNVRKSSLSSLHIDKLKNAFDIYRNLKFSIFMSFFCIIRLYFNAFIKKYL